MAETITREQAIDELVRHCLEVAEDKQWLISLFKYGIKGFGEMDMEELQDEYNDIFNNEEDRIIITEN